MSKKQVVGDISIWVGMKKDFWRQVGDGSITTDQFQKFLEHKNPFEFNPDQILEYWYQFYKDQFSIQSSLSGLILPKPQYDATWHIVTLEEVTEQVIFERCRDENKKRHFPCWKWTEKSLNDVLKPDRTTKGTHVGLFRDQQEADEELNNLSANMLEEKGIVGITLKQREIMELDYYLRTGKHLDVHNCTQCSGSRYFDGDVPSVYWDDGEMGVDWYISDSYNDNLRSRQKFLKKEFHFIGTSLY